MCVGVSCLMRPLNSRIRVCYRCRCGHCKKLAPEWKKAANNLKGKVKLGHVNCDAEKVS